MWCSWLVAIIISLKPKLDGTCGGPIAGTAEFRNLESPFKPDPEFEFPGFRENSTAAGTYLKIEIEKQILSWNVQKTKKEFKINFNNMLAKHILNWFQQKGYVKLILCSLPSRHVTLILRRFMEKRCFPKKIFVLKGSATGYFKGNFVVARRHRGTMKHSRVFRWTSWTASPESRLLPGPVAPHREPDWAIYDVGIIKLPTTRSYCALRS